MTRAGGGGFLSTGFARSLQIYFGTTSARLALLTTSPRPNRQSKDANAVPARMRKLQFRKLT